MIDNRILNLLGIKKNPVNIFEEYQILPLEKKLLIGNNSIPKKIKVNYEGFFFLKRILNFGCFDTKDK